MRRETNKMTKHAGKIGSSRRLMRILVYIALNSYKDGSRSSAGHINFSHIQPLLLSVCVHSSLLLLIYYEASDVSVYPSKKRRDVGRSYHLREYTTDKKEKERKKLALDLSSQKTRERKLYIKNVLHFPQSL